MKTLISILFGGGVGLLLFLLTTVPFLFRFGIYEALTMGIISLIILIPVSILVGTGLYDQL